MPGSIPELSEIGPQLEGQALQELREEVRVLLNRRTNHFPGMSSKPLTAKDILISGAQPVSLLKRHFETLKKEEYCPYHIVITGIRADV